MEKKVPLSEINTKDITKISAHIFSDNRKFVKLIGSFAFLNNKISKNTKGLFCVQRSDGKVFQYETLYHLGKTVSKNGQYPPNITELKKIQAGNFIIYDCQNDSGYIEKNLNLFFMALKSKHFILYDVNNSTKYKTNGQYRRTIYKIHSLGSFTVVDNPIKLYNVLVKYPDFLRNRDNKTDIGVSVRDERVKSAKAKFLVKDKSGMICSSGKIISLNKNGFSAMLDSQFLTNMIIGTSYTLLFEDTKTTNKFVCKVIEPGGFSVFKTEAKEKKRIKNGNQK